MPETHARGCSRCGAQVPEGHLSCPACGKFFEGGFELGELVDGFRSGHADLSPSAAEPPVDEWRQPSRFMPTDPTVHGGHHVWLPPVGPVDDLPYATEEDAGQPEADVIDLRDAPARLRPAPRWGRRSRTRA